MKSKLKKFRFEKSAVVLFDVEADTQAHAEEIADERAAVIFHHANQEFPSNGIVELDDGAADAIGLYQGADYIDI